MRQNVPFSGIKFQNFLQPQTLPPVGRRKPPPHNPPRRLRCLAPSSKDKSTPLDLLPNLGALHRGLSHDGQLTVVGDLLCVICHKRRNPVEYDASNVDTDL